MSTVALFPKDKIVNIVGLLLNIFKVKRESNSSRIAVSFSFIEIGLWFLDEHFWFDLTICHSCPHYRSTQGFDGMVWFFYLITMGSLVSCLNGCHYHWNCIPMQLEYIGDNDVVWCFYFQKPFAVALKIWNLRYHVTSIPCLHRILTSSYEVGNSVCAFHVMVRRILHVQYVQISMWDIKCMIAVKYWDTNKTASFKTDVHGFVLSGFWPS